MYKDKKLNRNMPDLTRTVTASKSVGAQLETLIKNITKYNLIQLKAEVTRILDDPATHVSPMAANRYKDDMARIYNLNMMQKFVTNTYLAAAKMSLRLK